MITELVLIAGAVGIRKYLKKPAGEYELKIGYENMLLFPKPLIVNMKLTPHCFICGLSNSGKTCMVEYAMRGKNVILINAFEDDFKSIRCRRIIGNDNILKFFQNLLENMKNRRKDEKPLYLVIDELLVLCIDKAITKAIQDILAIGRHYGVYIIGICQLGTKESVKFKDLFNVRVCFRQVEESSYRAILGYSPEDTKLNMREFYLYSDRIARGYTYTIN